jgi:HD-like signal output (HDOD) protein
MNAQARQLRARLVHARLEVQSPIPASAATGEFHPLRPLLERLETELERGVVLLPPWSSGTERMRRALIERPDDEDLLADLVAGEAGLAVRLLAFANASPLARGGRELAELRPALRRMGHMNLLAIVHAHALAQLRHSPMLVAQRTDR